MKIWIPWTIAFLCLAAGGALLGSTVSGPLGAVIWYFAGMIVGRHIDPWRRHADIALRAENDYLTTEVQRLMTQVALHINRSN